MNYETSNIRNICLLGHGGSGKTTLAEACLYYTKGIDRLGKVTDGNTVCDYDAEEIKRQFSLSLALAPVEYNGMKFNFLDTPGFFDFEAEVLQGLRPSGLALIVLTAKDGIQVGTEKAFKLCSKQSKPAIFFVNKMDEEHADFGKVLRSLIDTFGKCVCPIEVPIIRNGGTEGYYSLILKKVVKYKDGKAVFEDPDDSVKLEMEEFDTIFNEIIAETNEELMEKFFEEKPFTIDEIKEGIKDGLMSHRLFPVLCGSAAKTVGMATLLDFMKEYTPDPTDTASKKTVDGELIKCDPDSDVSLFIFKTVADPFVGKLSYFKVVSGTVKPDMILANPRTGGTEKLGKIYIVKGKKQSEVDIIRAGDIGAVTKLTEAETCDTLCSPNKPVSFPPIEFPKSTYSCAIVPKAKGDEEKISTGMHRLLEEDATLSFEVNKETKQLVLSGMGDMHIDVVISRLKNKFGVSVTTEPERIPYRETIKKKVRVQGRHKKQTGGHGQFGDVWIEFEPGDQEELEFAETVFGGAVPKNFFPAVEKGLRECTEHGVLAGYPVVFLKATLADGSYHPVDSSEMAFKLAAHLAYKAGLAQAGSVLLEPIMTLKVTIPDAYLGDVMGDISKRRGTISGINQTEDGQEVVAEVPMSELTTYSIDLRSMTQGRASFTTEFSRYQEVPATVAEKVIEETKKWMQSETDDE